MQNAFEKFIKEKCMEKGYSLRKIGLELEALGLMSVNNFYKAVKEPGLISATQMYQISKILHLSPRQTLRLAKTFDIKKK
jgi:hypothetical protein